MRLFLFLLSLSTALTEKCPPNAIKSSIGKKCFISVYSPMNFKNAQNLCRTFGGGLALITNQRDNDLLLDYASKEFHKRKTAPREIKVWVGVMNHEEKHNCSKESSAECSYSNWGPEHPCALLDAKSGRWKIENCTKELPFLCETAPTVITGPVNPLNKTCAKDWKQYGTNCYRYYADESTWPRAEQFCAMLGGHLASIHHKSEMHFLATQFEHPALLHRVWLGGKRDYFWPNHKYKWSDDTPWDFTNWHNHLQASESCVSTASAYEAFNPKWDTFACNTLASFFCKKPA